MNWIRVLLWLIPRRLQAHWVLLVITSFGILAAVVLMAIGPIYSRALSEGGLRHTIASISATFLNSHIVIRNRPLGSQDYDNLRSTVEGVAGRRIGHLTWDIQRWAKAHQYLGLAQRPDPGPQPPGEDGVQAQMFFMSEFQEHSRLEMGTWPQNEPVLDEGGVKLDTVVGRGLYRDLGLRPGSTLYLVPFPSDRSEVITLQVSGVAAPTDARDEYWIGAASGYFNIRQLGERILLPMYISEEHFLGGLGARYPSLVGDYGWNYFLDTDPVTGATVDPTMEALQGLDREIGKRYPQSLVFSGLDNTLADYKRDLTLARAPLFLFLFLVVMVMLYFLSLILGLLTRTRSDEAGLFRSRGASMPQMTGLLALGEAVIVLLAVVIGPFLALAIVKYLLADTIKPLGGATSLPIGLSADMFVMGAIGGVLSLAVLVLSSLGLARMGMVESLSHRARPPSVPLLQRYYVDVALLIGAGLLWWQIQTREGFIEEDVLGTSLELDPTLLVGPVVALLALGLLMFRVLPWLMKLIGWAASRLSPAWVAFGLVRAARDPLPHSSLAVILMMGTALGVFGAAFQPSLSQSERDQALFDLGADVVLHGARLSPEEENRLANTEGVRAMGPFGRQSVSLVNSSIGNRGSLLTVDPDSLSQTAWFRDDFSEKGLTELVRPLRNPPGGVQRIPLPEEAESLGVWVNTDGMASEPLPQRLNLWFRISDDAGFYHNLQLGQLAVPEPDSATLPQGWNYMETPLRLTTSQPLRKPLSLVSIFVTGPNISRLPPGSISLDDVTAKGAFPDDGTILVEPFDSPGTWEALPNGRTETHSAELTTRASRIGEGAGLLFSWQQPQTQIPMGVFIPPGPFPLPAVGGPSFGLQDAVTVRSGRQLVPLTVSGVTDLFPTVVRSMRPFLLVSLDDYREYLDRVAFGNFTEPTTYWISLSESVDRERSIDAIRSQLPTSTYIQDSETVGSQAQRNPLAGGGWNGLTVLGIVAITVAVILALGTYAVISVQSGRVDLAVVRTLGFSRTQFLLSLGLEKVMVAVMGIGAGIVAGVWLSRWVLGFLDVTSTGQDVLPPLVVTSHQGLIALVLIALAAAVGAALFMSILSARKLNAPEILRTGL